jgi:hypothetical protein
MLPSAAPASALRVRSVAKHQSTIDQRLPVASPRGRRPLRRDAARSCLDDGRRLPTSPAGSQRLLELRNTIHLTGSWARSDLPATPLATTSGSPRAWRNRRHLADSRRTSRHDNANTSRATTTAAVLATQITVVPPRLMLLTLLPALICAIDAHDSRRCRRAVPRRASAHRRQTMARPPRFRQRFSALIDNCRCTT